MTYKISRKYGRTTTVLGTVTLEPCEVNNYLTNLIREDTVFGACFIATPIKKES